MVTFKPIVVPSNRRRDGTYLVAIRVYHAGACRRVPTNLVAGPGDLTRSLRIKSKDILDRAGVIVDRMRSAVADLTEGDLAGQTVDWVVDRINRADRRTTFALDFFAFADQYVAGLSPGARGQYVTALNTFEAFLGRRAIDVNDITRALVAEFLAWMPGRAFSFASGRVSPSTRTRIPGGAESRATAKLAHIYARAQERYNDEDEDLILIPRSPFRGMVPKAPPSHGQQPLEPDVMQRVIDARHPLPTVQTSLDAFVVSFALMGANLADLYEAEGVGPVWEYHRRKTRGRRADGALMRVAVPDEIRGRMDAALPELRRMAGRREYATGKVNKGLARWCEDEGVDRFTFYAARHTWATLARRAGVEKATVDECLCHVGDFRLTDIYAERSWALMDAANRTVLDLFRW